MEDADGKVMRKLEETWRYREEEIPDRDYSRLTFERESDGKTVTLESPTPLDDLQVGRNDSEAEAENRYLKRALPAALAREEAVQDQIEKAFVEASRAGELADAFADALVARLEGEPAE